MRSAFRDTIILRELIKLGVPFDCRGSGWVGLWHRSLGQKSAIGSVWRAMTTEVAWVRLGRTENWRNVARLFPALVHKIPLFASPIQRAFDRQQDFDSKQIGIFGLGRLALEDFLEIMFLVEHGLGIAALKLSRGLFEKAITAEYISHFPDEAQRFHDFYPVQAQKLRTRSSKVYPDGYIPPANDALSEWNELMKSQFKTEPCVACGQPRQHGFTDRSLEAMALAVGEKWCLEQNEPKKSPNQFLRAYLTQAAIPNIHIHASMQSFFWRCTFENGQMSFRQDQTSEIHMAFTGALSMMPLVLHTQNRYFGLGLQGDIDAICAGLQEGWTQPNSETSTG